MSSASSCRALAAALSIALVIWLAPGIGMITGDFASNHASAT